MTGIALAAGALAAARCARTELAAGLVVQSP
jgi:hypothetical protein